jgi:hypothetical protein
MPTDLQPTFAALRTILRNHQAAWSVQEDSATCYCLAGVPGPATLKSWGGQRRVPTIPVAWVHLGKSAVSYHLMGVAASTALLAGLSKDLKARMQGKTCFNFKTVDDAVFRELDDVTAKSIAGFKRAGFASEPDAG